MVLIRDHGESFRVWRSLCILFKHLQGSCFKASQAQLTEHALGQVQQYLKRRFSAVEPWTDYFVCNTYYHADNAIGEHSDSDVHWGAIDGESVILSYTYDQAGIMLIFPSCDAKYNLDKTFINSLWSTGDYPSKTNRSAQLIGNQVIEAVLLRPNSMLAMGGFFQGQMLHETMPHALSAPQAIITRSISL